MNNVNCDGNLSEKDLFDSSQMMYGNKSPRNDGLTKEFYIAF